MTNQEAITQYADYLDTMGKTARTIKTYVYEVTRFFDAVSKPYDEVIVPDIGGYIKSKKKDGNVGTSINTFINSINSFYRYLNEYHVWENHIKHKTIPDKGQQQRLDNRDFLSPQLFEDYITKNELYFRRKPSILNYRRWIVMYLTMYGGIRSFEICNITEKDIVQMDNGLYKITITKGKGEKFREVALPEFFQEPYELYLAAKKEWKLDSEYLLCSFNNKQLNQSAINAFVDWLTKNAGLDLDLCPHRLRDSYVDYSISKGVDIARVSVSLGHKQVSTTIKKYMHNNEGIQLDIPSFFKRPGDSNQAEKKE